MALADRRLAGGCGVSGLRREGLVSFGATIAEKLPDPPDFFNHFEIEVGNHHFVLVATALGDDLAARVAEVTLAVELTDVPRLLPAHTIHPPHDIAIRDPIPALLQFPHIFG